MSSICFAAFTFSCTSCSNTVIGGQLVCLACSASDLLQGEGRYYSPVLTEFVEVTNVNVRKCISLPREMALTILACTGMTGKRALANLCHKVLDKTLTHICSVAPLTSGATLPKCERQTRVCIATGRRPSTRWAVEGGSQPGYESLPRIQQLLIRESLGYLGQWRRHCKDATVETLRAEYDGREPGDHANTWPTVARMMGFMFGTTQDVQAADLSEVGKMRLKELVPVAGVDSVAKHQQLLAYAGKGDLFRHSKGEGKRGGRDL